MSCRFCGSERPRFFGYCRDCDSLFGFPVVGWAIVTLLALGVLAMVLGVVPRT